MARLKHGRNLGSQGIEDLQEVTHSSTLAAQSLDACREPSFLFGNIQIFAIEFQAMTDQKPK